MNNRNCQLCKNYKDGYCEELELIPICPKVGCDYFSRQYRPIGYRYSNIYRIAAELNDFARWVATEIFDDMWEYNNKDSFAEIACQKLEKLGIVRAKGDEWELVEPQERSDKE